MKHGWNNGWQRENRGEIPDELWNRLDREAEAAAAVNAAKEGAETRRLAAMPVEIASPCGKRIYRREAAVVLCSYQGGDFHPCYDLRRGEDVFNLSLVQYLSGGR